MSLLSKLGHVAAGAVGTVAHAVEGTAKNVASAVSDGVKDGFEGVLQSVERNGVVIGSGLYREIGKLTGPSTLGPANPSAGVGKPPVILLSGQGGTASVEMAAYAKSLERDGFKVYCFDDPQHGMESAKDASAQLDALVDRVRAQTGATKVSLVGYSSGGTNARAYVNLYGGADKVDRVVQVAGSNNGDPGAFEFCASGREEKLGSPFMKDLNAHVSDVPIYSIYEQGGDGEVVESDAKLYAAPTHHNLPMPQSGKHGLLYMNDHIHLPQDERAYAQVITALTA